MTAARLDAVRAGYGVALLVVGVRRWRAARPAGGFLILLGARHLVQGLAGAGRLTTSRADVLADGTHAASMLALAAWSPELRRGALTAAGEALAWTGADRAAGAARGRRPG